MVRLSPRARGAARIFVRGVGCGGGATKVVVSVGSEMTRWRSPGKVSPSPGPARAVSQ